MLSYVPSMAGAQNQIGQDQMEEMLSIGEAADFIGVSVDTLRRWSKKKRVTTYRSPGGHRYYKKGDLAGLFDARYTRDEDTERSSQEKSQVEEEQDVEKQTSTNDSETDQSLDTEDMTIPRMQPVRVLSDDQNFQDLPMPDMTAPPPPMPFTQVQTHVQVETVTVDQTKTNTPQYYRQPAAPIHRQEEKKEQNTDTQVNTVISDFTSGGGFQEERTRVETSYPQFEPEKRSIENEQPYQDPTSSSHEPSAVTLQPPWRVPAPPTEDTEQDEVSEKEEITEKLQKEIALEDQKTAAESKNRDEIEENIEDTTKHIKIAEESSTTTDSQQKEEERLTIDERPSPPSSSVNEISTKQQEEPIKTQEKAKKSEPKEEDTVTQLDKIRSLKEIESPSDKTKKTEYKTDTPPPQLEHKSEKKPVNEKTAAPLTQEQKRSILEPDGIDASKLNKLEKMNDESWFTKNKSNILIGFTVFLLIDIILFVIWLTTSRILSPIP